MPVPRVTEQFHVGLVLLQHTLEQSRMLRLQGFQNICVLVIGVWLDVRVHMSHGEPIIRVNSHLSVHQR